MFLCKFIDGFNEWFLPARITVIISKIITLHLKFKTTTHCNQVDQIYTNNFISICHLGILFQWLFCHRNDFICHVLASSKSGSFGKFSVENCELDQRNKISTIFVFFSLKRGGKTVMTRQRLRHYERRSEKHACKINQDQSS